MLDRRAVLRHYRDDRGMRTAINAADGKLCRAHRIFRYALTIHQQTQAVSGAQRRRDSYVDRELRPDVPKRFVLSRRRHFQTVVLERRLGATVRRSDTAWRRRRRIRGARRLKSLSRMQFDAFRTRPRRIRKMHDAVFVHPAPRLLGERCRGQKHQKDRKEFHGEEHTASRAPKQKRRPNIFGRRLHNVAQSRQNASEAVIHLEFDRMSRHSHTCHLSHFQTDVAIDEVVREDAARLQELPIGIERFQCLLQ